MDDVVVSTVEARPVAVPAGATTGFRAAPLILDATQSLNPNLPSAPNTGLTYRWALLSRPAGSAATLANPTIAKPTFIPDVYGLYVAQLIVSGLLDSRPATMVLQVVPRPPVAQITAPSTTQAGQTVALGGSGSIDPDGNPLTYAWALTSKPAGSAATLASATAVASSFVSDLAGTYTAQLVVADAYGVSTPAVATIVAQGGGFAFNPIAPQSVALGSSLQLTIRATDPQNKPVIYSLVGSLPGGATFDASSGAFSFRPASNSPGAYSFTFNATNGVNAASLTVPVTVTGAPTGPTALSVTVYDAVNYASGTATPAAGVVVKVGAVSATTSSNGVALLSGIPAGADTVIVSTAAAATAPDGSRYMDTAVAASVIDGVTNTLGKPILLARGGGGVPINGAGATVVTNPSLGLTLTIAPNSAFNATARPTPVRFP